MHSSTMSFRPVNPAARSALCKSIVGGKHVRRHASRHKLTRNRSQNSVASGASRQRNHARVETEVSDSLAQLTPDGVALDEKNVGRGTKAFVARDQDSVVRASNPEKLSAGQRRVVDNVGAEQAQPARQSHQHPVNGDSGSFIHRDGCIISPFDESAVRKNIKRQFKF